MGVVPATCLGQGALVCFGDFGVVEPVQRHCVEGEAVAALVEASVGLIGLQKRRRRVAIEV